MTAVGRSIILQAAGFIPRSYTGRRHLGFAVRGKTTTGVQMANSGESPIGPFSSIRGLVLAVCPLAALSDCRRLPCMVFDLLAASTRFWGPYRIIC